jgi:hypothetical protein
MKNFVSSFAKFLFVYVKSSKFLCKFTIKSKTMGAIIFAVIGLWLIYKVTYWIYDGKIPPNSGGTLGDY